MWRLTIISLIFAYVARGQTWGAWTQWRACTKTCRASTADLVLRYRYRTCSASGCIGNSYQSVLCTGLPVCTAVTKSPTTKAPTTGAPTTKAPTTKAPTTGAPTTKKPTSATTVGYWGVWGVWGSCAATCRASIISSVRKYRYRACLPKGSTCSAGLSYNSLICLVSLCPGTTKAPTTGAPTTKAPTTKAPTTKAPTTGAPTTKQPTTTASPTSSAVGNWGAWATWGSCAATCRLSALTLVRKYRYRACSPKGSKCTGLSYNSQFCLGLPFCGTTKAPTTGAPTTKAPTTKAPTTSRPTQVTGKPILRASGLPRTLISNTATKMVLQDLQVSSTHIYVKFTCVATKWCALGFPRDGFGMSGTDAIVRTTGKVSSRRRLLQTVKVQNYALTGKISSAVKLMTTQALFNVKQTISGSTVTVEVSRPLTIADTNAKKFTATAQCLYINYAVGSSLALAYHGYGSANRGYTNPKVCLVAIGTKAPTTAAPTTKAPTTAAPTTGAPTTAAPTSATVGYWGAWSVWGKCAATCKASILSVVRRYRYRKCPTGSKCLGLSYGSSVCVVSLCGTKAPTTKAPTTKAPTTKTPTTKAPTTGAPTTKAPTSTKAPTAATTKSPTQASTGGIWGAWSVWGSCAATCRSSVALFPRRYRYRACSTKGSCTGLSYSSVVCLVGLCTTKAPTTAAPTSGAPTTKAPTTKAPTTAAPTTGSPTTAAPTSAAVGYWGAWSVWGKCAATCRATLFSVVRRYRYRKCTGSKCLGLSYASSVCVVSLCGTKAPTTKAPTTKAPTTGSPTTKAPTTTGAPTTKQPTSAQAGYWGAWSVWGSCRATCRRTVSSVVVRYRYRSCVPKTANCGVGTTVGLSVCYGLPICPVATKAPTTAAPTTAAPTTAAPTAAPTPTPCKYATKVVISPWTVKKYAPITVTVGSSLTFYYSSFHNVWQLKTATAYRVCAFTSATGSLLSGTTGSPYTIKFTTPGTYYYGCSRGTAQSHCKAGQKITVTVTKCQSSAPTNSPTTPAPSAAPTTTAAPSNAPTTKAPTTLSPTGAPTKLIQCTKNSDCKLKGWYCDTKLKVCRNFNINDRILGNYLAGGDWYAGRIATFNGTTGLYGVQYDDGDYEFDVPASRLEPLTFAIRSAFQYLELVEAYRTVSKEWRRATVRILQKNGLYTVEFSASPFDVQINTNATSLRPLVVWRKGQKVQASLCYWWKATIKKVQPDGTYLVQFSDGYQGNVPFDKIRKITVRYIAGQSVQVKTSSGAWVPGFIAAITDDGNTYTVVLYSTGNVISNVKPSSLRNAP